MVRRSLVTCSFGAFAVLTLAFPAFAQVTSPVKPPRNAVESVGKSIELETKGLLSWLFRPRAAKFPREFRTIDASENNPMHPGWGGAGSELMRLMEADYADGSSAPAGGTRLSPRAISNGCVAQTQDIPNSHQISDMFWQWGQFLDHDLSLVGTMDPVEPFDVAVPMGDPFFDPMSTGTKVIPVERSFYRMIDGVREQVNELTAYIDASQVYGSDAVRAQALRKLDGTGRMKMSKGRLLPYNTQGLENAMGTDPSFFLAGDIRANEQVALTAMHTVFVREHNWWAKRIRQEYPNMDGEKVYQCARALVAAEMQAITYNEFLPILLGPDALKPYVGYKAYINSGIMNEFATAAYRFGHTMLSSELKRLDANMQPIPEGHLALADAFFNPTEYSDIGIEPYLRGQSFQIAQEVDSFIVDDVRNFLFGPPGSGGFDLASLNIQRGRDHGLPDYNAVRVAAGLPARTDFTQISSDPGVQNALASMYASVDDIDLWVGGLAEDHVPGAIVGETFWTIIKIQFEALRDGDRFWYKEYLPGYLVEMVEARTLSKIIRRNTKIGSELQQNVFVVPNP
ncbi:MAG: putative peroxidase [Candidatus Hydrogenedentota bacterium]